MKENSEQILSQANMLLQEAHNTSAKSQRYEKIGVGIPTTGGAGIPTSFAEAGRRGENARRADNVGAEASVEKNEQRGPHFLTKINEEKSNGWGQSLKILVAKNNYVISLAVAGLVIATLGYAMLNFAIPNNLTPADDAAAIGSGVQAEFNLINSSNINFDVTQTFTETAAEGEGVTHLARRALSSYLSVSGYVLNAEQKIYVEDYLKDITGSYGLKIGQKVSFSVADIELAYASALGLADWQIENLTQYTFTVSNL